MTIHEEQVTERLCLLAPGQLAWLNEELPPLGPQDVLVRTSATAISIGSELPVYRGDARTSDAFQYPRKMGYESVGAVVARGDAVRRVRPGERVVCFYGQQTYAVVPQDRLIVVPQGISDALAILSILTCDAAKGVRKLAPRPEETALITGAGAIGLLTLFILRAYGVSQIDVVELVPERHSLARLLGARHVWRPQDMPAETSAYPVAFECSSRDQAFALLQQKVQPQGRICVTADGNVEPLTLTPEFHEKELQIVGSSDGWDYQQHAAWYFHILQQHPTGLENLFEVRITRHELISTFERLAAGVIHPVKVLISYIPSGVP
ncbi:zinc-dependent alcohol dehydrogenase [Dictyobacter aurantiacus]|uniref:Alcohol dehydrogenase n=1 Tax=Dictyobacter aurantiacus TaxID=1936993 RepID=A0A401ZJ43_9CHLR|nr:zinc-binding alcohol dehydrogenase [Dictyobacter aurantiacus]GCE06862.1 alcohol dehydrogenase [Dictyobacter aurantiacus]